MRVSLPWKGRGAGRIEKDLVVRPGEGVKDDLGEEDRKGLALARSERLQQSLLHAQEIRQGLLEHGPPSLREAEEEAAFVHGLAFAADEPFPLEGVDGAAQRVLRIAERDADV